MLNEDITKKSKHTEYAADHKSMKLVSTVKLQKAKSRAEQTNPYSNYMYQTVTSMLARSGGIDHPYLKKGTSTKKAIVVITSNRGLAGGYNSNLIKLVTGSDFSKDDVEIYAIGGKGREVLERRGYHIKEDDSYIIESPSYDDCGRTLQEGACGLYQWHDRRDLSCVYTF